MAIDKWRRRAETVLDVGRRRPSPAAAAVSSGRSRLADLALVLHLLHLLPGECRFGRRRAALRPGTAHRRAGAAPQAAADRDVIARAGAAPAQGGVRLPDGRGGVRTEYAEDERPPRGADADRRSQRRDVEWIVQYKITDPYKYCSRCATWSETLRDMTEASMREVVGDHSVTEVLTVGREAIQAKAKELLQELCDRYETGIAVAAAGAAGREPARAGQAVVQRGEPGHPGERARHQRGLGGIQPEIPARAAGASRRIRRPRATRIDRVNRAKGDAERFIALQTSTARRPR